jgi:outer membrane protein OmpA-like peptidoglycan-associated protein
MRTIPMVALLLLTIGAGRAAAAADATAPAASVGAAGTQSAPELSRPDERLTDESLHSDLCVFDAWRARLDTLAVAQPPRSLYHRTKALGWLEFARQQYLADDRSGVVERALQLATDQIRRMEAGNTDLGWTTPVLKGTNRLGGSTWDLSTRLHFDPGFKCVEAEVAKLEMELIRAEYARAQGDSCLSRSHVEAADVLADYVSATARSCRPKPAPTAAEIRRQIEMLPTFVHFALDSSRVVPASATVLDHILTVLNAYPRIAVQIEGHADRRGSVPYNLALSRRRAEAVRDYLVRSGLTPSRVNVYYYGKARPRVAGDDVQAFARNRCVIFHYLATENADVEAVPQEQDLQVESGAVPKIARRPAASPVHRDRPGARPVQARPAPRK